MFSLIHHRIPLTELELVGHYFIWHIQVLSWRMCESQHKQLEGSVLSVIVHRSLAGIGCAPAIICRAPAVVCHALVLYMVSCVGVVCRCHALVSHRLSLVMRWSFAVGRPPSSTVSRWLSAVVCCRSWVVRRWLLVVRIPLSVVHRWSLLVVRC